MFPRLSLINGWLINNSLSTDTFPVLQPSWFWHMKHLRLLLQGFSQSGRNIPTSFDLQVCWDDWHFYAANYPDWLGFAKGPKCQYVSSIPHIDESYIAIQWKLSDFFLRWKEKRYILVSGAGTQHMKKRLTKSQFHWYLTGQDLATAQYQLLLSQAHSEQEI